MGINRDKSIKCPAIKVAVLFSRIYLDEHLNATLCFVCP